MSFFALPPRLPHPLPPISLPRSLAPPAARRNRLNQWEPDSHKIPGHPLPQPSFLGKLPAFYSIAPRSEEGGLYLYRFPAIWLPTTGGMGSGRGVGGKG